MSSGDTRQSLMLCINFHLTVPHSIDSLIPSTQIGASSFLVVHSMYAEADLGLFFL